MLQNVIRPERFLEQFPINLRRLFDDAGVRNDHDNAAKAPKVLERQGGVMAGDVLECECKRRQCFSAAGRRGQREQAGLLFGRIKAILKQLSPQRVDRAAG